MTRRYLMVLLVLAGMGILSRPLNAQLGSLPQGPKPKGNAIDVARMYAPSGWMGDAMEGTTYVQQHDAYEENPTSHPACIKVTYKIGPKGWAGIYWLNKPNNWGDRPGEDLSKVTYSKITFSARGEQGGETVEFKAGGIDAEGKKYKDSFEITKGKVRLEKAWNRYEIDMTRQNLSSVIGLFCWVASGTANPNGLTFYLDDIRYE